MPRYGALLAFGIALLLLPGASAHVPNGTEGNDSLAEALPVPDASKSWVFYGELEARETHYYRLDYRTGDRIALGLIIPTEEARRGFSPDLILMGPGSSEGLGIPPEVEVPQGWGSILVPGRLPADPTYEPFSATVHYSVSAVDASADTGGPYFVAVFGGPEAGKYGLVVGYREAFTLGEWILTPITLVSVYTWGGHTLLTVLLPLLLIPMVGLALLGRRRPSRRPSTGWSAWVVIVGGLLYVAGAGVVLLQTMTAMSQASVSPVMGLTAVWIVLPALLGVGILRIAWKLDGTMSGPQRLTFLGLGLLGLLLWAGFLVGPFLLAGAASLPKVGGVSASRAARG